MLVTGEETTKRSTLEKNVFDWYKQLVSKIPVVRFSQFDLQNQMSIKMYNSKAENGSVPSFYKSAKKVKDNTQLII